MITLGELKDGRVSKLTKGRDDKVNDRNIDTLKDVLTSLDFVKNFQCELIENIILKNGISTKISHGLNTVPRFKIITRQNGNGVIYDSPIPWTNKEIYLVSNGVDQVISILIFK